MYGGGGSVPSPVLGMVCRLKLRRRRTRPPKKKQLKVGV